ncbi:glycosyltransferase family 2 protein [Allorhizobium sp. BGMRC 0089]|uniref:glycosyltransferase family 2 protein n=1 Tax=Allorhizobium sonneratiae TaxID=2934936 RepID=UPI0020336888|nr:glycosyltransferase family 2 protein [Allorhizobium sonneratiae]MCM2291420.1 glycosyltransferase family 2 protein [Allorhizobium sonneratiae]
MPKLSLCIPVEPGHDLPLYLVRELLKDKGNDLEIILSAFGDVLHQSPEITAIAANDARLRLLPPAPESISSAQLWVGTVRAAEGDWVSLIYPEDMIEPHLPELLTYVERVTPEATALGWSPFQIDAAMSPDVRTNVAVPVLHNITAFDKAPMLEAFFFWKDARQTPRMPFGLYHGAIKRELMQAVIDACGEISWLTLVPQYEWAARVLIFAEALAYCNRTLSAVHVRPFATRDVPSVLRGFPLHAGVGLTAAIAEVQARTLMELGSEWSGFGEAFVTACMYDCAMEHDASAFQGKCAAYRQAIAAMPGGQSLLQGFQPPFSSTPYGDERLGLYGKTLLVDRFIGQAKTAQDFYRVMSAILTPVRIMTDEKVKLLA